MSDGLLGDLSHILQASQVGAEIDYAETIKLIATSAHPSGASMRFNPKLLAQCALAGGDDYELCFTAPVAQRAAVQAASHAADTPVQRIGRITAGSGIRVLDAQGQAMDLGDLRSFDHFSAQ